MNHSATERTTGCVVVFEATEPYCANCGFVQLECEFAFEVTFEFEFEFAFVFEFEVAFELRE